MSGLQGISGVAKDITKTASKSAIKATSSEGGNGQLFKWVAWFTGSKNAMKGFGFFAGGLLLELVGFRPALWLMAALLVLVLGAVVVSLPTMLGKAKASKSFAELFAKSRAVNLISAATDNFLFGSRDVWFVACRAAGVPLRERLEVHPGGRLHRRLDRSASGFVQAMAPSVIRRSSDGLSWEIPEARLWGVVLDDPIRAVLPVLVQAHISSNPALLVVVGLSVFGFAFAVISSRHCISFSRMRDQEVVEDVGFYYAATAAGRLSGILLSGLLTQFGGLPACLWGSAVMLALCLMLVFALPGGVEHRPMTVSAAE